MSFEPPAGILDIGNATLRVGKLEVAETSGLNQGLQNIVKNDLLITETTEYTTNHTWGLKLPTAWVADFDIKGGTGKYVEFNFYNEGSTSNAQGYTLHFEDTTLTLKYDNGNTLASATIPTIVGTYRKVNIFFERGVIAVSIDGARVLYYKESDGFNNGLGVASRVASTTGGSFVNAFFESDHGGNSGFKNLRIVNGRFISDKTSNVSFIGSLGVGVNSPKESLDIRGNMHFNRVSNVSQIKVDSNVVTEYTGPHDRPLRKYPEVAMTQNDESATSGYVASASTTYQNNGSVYPSFAGDGGTTTWLSQDSAFDTNDPYEALNTASLFDGQRGEWIQLQLPNAIKVSYFKIIPRSTAGGTNAAPEDQTKRGSLYGSNDGTNFTKLIDYGDLDYGGATGQNVQIIHVNATEHYKYLRLLCTARYGNFNNQQWVGVGELEYYGHEEGSGSLDTTLKSVYNVPATTGTQLEVYYDAKDLTTMPSTVTDLSPNSNGGSVTGATLDTTDGIESFKFDASSSQRITSTIDTSYWGTNKLHSVSFWFKADTVAGKYNIFQIGNVAANQVSAFWISDGSADSNGGNSLNWWFYGGDSTLKTSSFSWALDTWYHIALTFDGSTKKLYVNGKHIYFSIVNTVPTANLPTGIPDSAPLVVGSTSVPGDYFDGSIANFRVYGAKTLNADQVKELYDYQKDYFLGSKSQVTLYKGHLGVGVAEPSGQLELAGDERIQEYPPGPLSANESVIAGHGIFKARSSPSSSLDIRNPWTAFNKSTVQGWDSIDDGSDYSTTDGSYTSNQGNTLLSSGGTYSGEFLEIELPYPIKLKTNYFYPQQNTTYGTPRFFREALVLGSNNGHTWDTLQSISETSYSYTYTSEEYLIVNTNSETYYKYFRVAVNKVIGGTNGNRVNINEWRLFGTPGPTTLDKGSLTLGRSLDVPRVSRYDVDTETPRPEKLVLDYDTTVNSSPTDISGRGNHGTMVGATYSAADKAFSFDGDDYIQGSLTNSSNFTNTVSLWFKMDEQQSTLGSAGTIGNRRTIFEYGPNRTTDLAYAFVDIRDTYMTIYMGDSFNLPSSAFAPQQNQWHHFMVMYSGSGTVRVFVDNVEYTNSLTSISTGTLALPTNTQLLIGSESRLNAAKFRGDISNFKVYSVALEPSEVRKLYNLGRTGRSMVISDTAVGIGKVPEAQLDVRGTGKFAGAMTVQGQTRLTDFVALGSGTNSTTRLFIDDPIIVKTWNAFNNNSSDGNYTFEARAITLVHFHYSGGEDPNISESYLIACSDTGSPWITGLKGAGYLYSSVGHGSRIVRFWSQALPSVYNSANFNLRISAIWKYS
jgi:hypothetical protein